MSQPDNFIIFNGIRVIAGYDGDEGEDDASA
jgi:hypothetical protein